MIAAPKVAESALRFIPGWRAPASWRTLIFFALFMGVFSLLKGFFTYLLIPMIPFVAIALLVTRRMHQHLLVHGKARPSIPIFARLQLYGITAFYFFLVALTDGSTTLAYGIMPVRVDGPESQQSVLLAFGGMLSFFVGTGAIFVSYVRAESWPKMRSLYQWATEFK